VTPADVAIAVRSLARRWRELLAGVNEREDDGEAILREVGDDGWSAVSRVCHLVNVFHRTADDLERVWVHDRPALHDPTAEPRHYSAASLPILSLLTSLAGAADRLGAVVEHYAGRQWERAGKRGEQVVPALELGRAAVHEAAHHLRRCRDELARRCKHPLDGEEDGT
jgi:hypothetical protein